MPSVIMISLLGQVLYIIDFGIAMILQDNFLGYYDYFLNTPVWTKVLVLIAHFSSLILLIFNYHIKPKLYHIFYSLLYFAILYIPMRYYVPERYNVNGIVTTYTAIDLMPLFHDLYVLYALIFVILPVFLILKLLYYLFSKTSHQ